MKIKIKATAKEKLNEVTTKDADATKNDIAKDKTAYVKGKKVVGELVVPSEG